MNQKLKLALAIAVGLIGGVLSSYLSPTSVFAQSRESVRLTGPIALVTGLGTKIGEVDLKQRTIKLNPNVKVRFENTDRTVTLELSLGN